MKAFHGLAILFVLMMLNGCSVVDPPSPEAGYIKIDSFQLSTDYIVQGSKASAITDAWVILDDGYLGTFPLPAKVPVITGKPRRVIIRAGIIENGISSIRSAYPKYTSFDTTIVFEPGKEVKIQPRITYLSGATFLQNEDFDDASLSLTSTSSSNTNLQVTSSGDPNSFEGNSGVATLSTTNRVFEVASSSLMNFSQAVPTYIELNYKSDLDFSVGVFINTSAGPVDQRTLLSLRATASWKKVYISVADLGGMATNAVGYKVFIRCENPTSSNQARLYLDNLKVVY